MKKILYTFIFLLLANFISAQTQRILINYYIEGTDTVGFNGFVYQTEGDEGFRLEPTILFSNHNDYYMSIRFIAKDFNNVDQTSNIEFTFENGTVQKIFNFAADNSNSTIYLNCTSALLAFKSSVIKTIKISNGHGKSIKFKVSHLLSPDVQNMFKQLESLQEYIKSNISF